MSSFGGQPYMSFFRFFHVSCLLVLLGAVASLSHAEDWPPIAPEEMKMTSVEEQPGAPAVILLRQETDDDMHNVHSFYVRIKVLTEAGRKYADVELPYNRHGRAY
jgi:hypothetical protein